MGPDKLAPEIVGERQRFLTERLGELDPQLVAQYRGAIRVLNDSGNPDRIALAAHGIREFGEHLTKHLELPTPTQGENLGDRVRRLQPVWEAARSERLDRSQQGECENTPHEDKLFKELDTFFRAVEQEKPTQRQRAERLVEELDVNRHSVNSAHKLSEVQRWLEIRRFFQRASHHSRTSLEDLLATLDRLQDFLIAKLHRQPSLDLTAIDQLLAKQQHGPTEELITLAIEQIHGGHVQRNHFFSRLTSAVWLERLWEHGLFSDPPASIASNGYVVYPIWEQSRCLVRLATEGCDPDLLVKVSLSIPETDNIRVGEDLLEVALALPASLSKLFVPLAEKWLAAPHNILTADRSAKLVVSLSAANQVKEAEHLARALLAVVPAPPSASGLRACQSVVHRNGYGDVLGTCLEALGEADWLLTLRLACDLLNRAFEISRSDGDEQGEDYSYVWHSAIEEEAGVAPVLSTSLLCAVRDVAERAIERQPDRFSAVIQELSNRTWTSFRRLILHLCAQFPVDGIHEAGTQFCDPAILVRPATRHEAARLLKRVFGTLSNARQSDILAWIAVGPDPDKVRRLLGTKATDQDVEDYSDRWRRDQLAIMAGQLPREYEEELAQLEDKLGPADRSDRAVKFEGWSGPSSPVTLEHLSERTPEGVIEEIKSWSPSGDWCSATPEGLGRVLKEDVHRRSTLYAAASLQFRGADPTYVRALFDGLRDAWRAGHSFGWSPVLQLGKWVFEQPRELPGRDRESFDADPDWGWSRKSVVNLVSGGLRDVDGRIPFAYRETVWEIIEAGSRDPDPTAEYEAEFGGDNMDPPTMAINTVRGCAFDAMFRYGLWVNACTAPDPTGNPTEQRTLDGIPELRARLEDSLGSAPETALSVRSVYGRRLPVIVHLDSGWAADRIPMILSADPEQPAITRAVWESYVLFNHASDAMWRLLAAYYEQAVNELGVVRSQANSLGDPDFRLGQHLVMLYVRGSIELDSGDGLLDGYFSRASPELRGHVLFWVGNAVAEESEELPTRYRERLTALFEWRLATLPAGGQPDDYAELSFFSTWFTSGCFELDWSVNCMVAIVDAGGTVRPDQECLSALLGCTAQYPLQSLKILRSILFRSSEPRFYILDFTEELLKRLLALDDKEVDFAVRQLVESLIADGHLKFRELLPLRGME